MSSWETRELKVLRAIERWLSTAKGRRGGGITVAELATRTRLSEADVSDSLRVLAEAHGPYVSGRFLLQSEPDTVVTGLTDRARVELDRLDRGVSSPGPGQGV